MEADKSPTRSPGSFKGGSVEPVNRAAVAKEAFQIPRDDVGERFELRDPFAEVTYRANTLAQIVEKPDQLGSSLVFAVAEDGTRTPVRKADGEWRIDPRSSTTQQRVEEREPNRPVQEVQLSLPRVVQRDAADTAKIDAQADREALVARLEAALNERYIIKRASAIVGEMRIGRTEYRFRGDASRVAFTESTFRLATDTNSPSVSRSMVDVAEARNWKALRVSGNEDFKRLVWLEASVRGLKTVGYEPQPGDLDLLKRQREARMVNRVEPTSDIGGKTGSEAPGKVSGRGGGRKAVLVAIEEVLVARRVPEKQRVAIIAAATEKLSQRIRDGQTLNVKVYDKSAPSQRSIVVPAPEIQRSRDRGARAPGR